MSPDPNADFIDISPTGEYGEGVFQEDCKHVSANGGEREAAWKCALKHIGDGDLELKDVNFQTGVSFLFFSKLLAEDSEKEERLINMTKAP